MRRGIFVIDISYLRCPRKSSVSQHAHTHTNFPQILPSQKMTPPTKHLFHLLISTATLDLLFLAPFEVLKQNPLASPAASIANGFPGGSESKEPACNAGDPGSIPGLGRSLEKGMETHSSVLAWKVPRQRSLVGYSLWLSQKSWT